jgi:LacI family transcriptional regulator
MSTTPVTTRLIAEKSGYGQSTVSMALRGDPRIPEATRRIITTTAAKLGYQPDPHFARLMSGVKRRNVARQAQTLAYVILWKSAQEHYHYRTYREYRQGAADRAAEFGYKLEDFVVSEGALTPRRLEAIMRTRVIPGMLVAPTSVPDVHAGLHGLKVPLACDSFAISTIGFTLDSPAVNRAMHDHALGTERAVEVLRQRKFRRIGLACSLGSHVRVQGRWLAGYLLAQAELLQQDRLKAFIPEDINDPVIFKDWLRQERPDVILAVEMEQISRQLERLHLRVPKDIALAHLDLNDDQSTFAGIYQRNNAIGAAAFDLLLAQMSRHERGVPPVRKTVMIEGEWREGKSI